MVDRRDNPKEYPEMHGTNMIAFDDFEARLKRWLWTYGDKSNYKAEVNVNMAAIFRPALILANMDTFRDHQMTLFQCLKHAFNEKHSEILRQAEQSVVINVNNLVSFGTTCIPRYSRTLQHTKFFICSTRNPEVARFVQHICRHPKTIF